MSAHEESNRREEMGEPLMNAHFDELRGHYGCGPVQFYGTDDTLYERHLVFDNVVAPKIATPRQQLEAVARSVRDIMSQRWLITEITYVSPCK
jgi:starch phosphorylase